MRIPLASMMALTMASQAWATDATPTKEQLDAALANAKSDWGINIDPVEIRLEAINPCDMFATPRIAVVETHDFHTIITYDDGTKADGGTTYTYVIKINSNCNWYASGLDLDKTVSHELGHILQRSVLHSKNPRSIMYPVVNSRQSILPEDWAIAAEVDIKLASK